MGVIVAYLEFNDNAADVLRCFTYTRIAQQLYCCKAIIKNIFKETLI